MMGAVESGPDNHPWWWAHMREGVGKKRPLAERLREAADWDDAPWWWDGPSKVGVGDENDSIRSLFLEAAVALEAVDPRED